MQQSWASAHGDGEEKAGGCGCLCPHVPVPAQRSVGQAASAAAWPWEGGKGPDSQCYPCLAGCSTLSLCRDPSPQGHTTAQLARAKDHACPSSDLQDRLCWTSVVPSPRPIPCSATARGCGCSVWHAVM